MDSRIENQTQLYPPKGSTESSSLIRDALPDGFSFYHLGYVQREPLLSKDSDQAAIRNELVQFPDHLVAAAFSLQGDVRGLILLIFEDSLDHSAYLEMGNILASRLATSLTNQNGSQFKDIFISPPTLLKAHQIRPILQSVRHDFTQITLSRYSHVYKGQVIDLPLIVLPAPQEGAAYA